MGRNALQAPRSACGAAAACVHRGICVRLSGSLRALDAALRDGSALFRHDVAFCMGQRQDPAAIARLKEILHDTSEHPMCGAGWAGSSAPRQQWPGLVVLPELLEAQQCN